MTEKQKFKFYFPAWNECCAANQWRMKKGGLLFNAERLTEEGKQVLETARRRAGNRFTTVDDMRHAAHIVALGRDKSSADLSNAELDRVVTFFKVLTDPEDLDAIMKWQAYQRGEDPGADRRVEYFIKQCPDAYVRAISEGKFGSRQWEWLTIAQKRELARTLSERSRSKKRAIESPDSTIQSEGGGKDYVLQPEKTYVKGPF